MSVPAPSPPCLRLCGSSPWLQKQHLLAPPPNTPGSPSDARASPCGGFTPAAKGLLSRAGPVPSAVTPAASGVALGCLRGGGTKHPDTVIPLFPAAWKFSAAT